MHAFLYLVPIISSLKRDTLGAIAAEYSFLLVFIAIVSAAGMVFLGDGLAAYFSAMGLAIGGAAQQS